MMMIIMIILFKNVVTYFEAIFCARINTGKVQDLKTENRGKT